MGRRGIGDRRKEHKLHRGREGLEDGIKRIRRD
jgi:hypothetical protein